MDLFPSHSHGFLQATFLTRCEPYAGPLATQQLTFPRTPEMEATQVTGRYHQLHCVQPEASQKVQPTLDGRGPHKGGNTRKQGSLGVFSEAAYQAAENS